VTSRRFWSICASFAVCATLAAAQNLQPVPVAPQPVSWLQSIWDLPVFRWLAGLDPVTTPVVPDAPAPLLAQAPALPPCSVAPLPAIIDPAAISLEQRTGPVVDLDGLTPRTSKALNRFEGLVEKHGGSMMLTSAFRPEAYQQHLRDVWYKWMTELKDNQDPSCADLKAEVGDEFVRHQLLPTQHPVMVSDHTLGIGFDAAVALPPQTTKKKRSFRISLDRIAHLAGMMRPDIGRDPVHFRLIGGRG
jgi:hypothetical protein